MSLGWCLAAVVVVLSLIPSPPEPEAFEGQDKVFHLAAYAMLMLWFGSIYLPGRALIKAAAYLIIMGIALEAAQGMGGHRSFQFLDMAANTAGVALGWCLSSTRLSKGFGLIESRIHGSPPGSGG